MRIRREPIRKAGWSEAEHPRALDGRFVALLGGGGLTYTGIVHAHVPRGEPFSGTHVADVQQVHPNGSATVSLHLPDDHPAVKDALGDGIVSSPSEMEAITTLPGSRVKANNDRAPLTPHIKRAFRALEAKRQVQRAAEQRQQREAERRANIEAYRRGELPKPPGIAELDASNRARREAATPQQPVHTGRLGPGTVHEDRADLANVGARENAAAEQNARERYAQERAARAAPSLGGYGARVREDTDAQLQERYSSQSRKVDRARDAVSAARRPPMRINFPSEGAWHLARGRKAGQLRNAERELAAAEARLDRVREEMRRRSRAG